MEDNKFYKLPELPYGYNALEPYMSEEQLRLHHGKHHLAYVNGANAILEKLEKARKEGTDLDIKAILKEFSFNVNGHKLHSIFWKTMKPAEKEENKAKGEVADAIEENFGSFERFKKEFSQAAVSVEGSGWAALVFDNEETKRLMITQIEKHNLNCFATFKILLPLDVWEHAYYLDYKNERAKFVEAFWNIVNWEEANSRFKKFFTLLNIPLKAE